MRKLTVVPGLRLGGEALASFSSFGLAAPPCPSPVDRTRRRRTGAPSRKVPASSPSDVLPGQLDQQSSSTASILVRATRPLARRRSSSRIVEVLAGLGHHAVVGGHDQDRPGRCRPRPRPCCAGSARAPGTSTMPTQPAVLEGEVARSPGRSSVPRRRLLFGFRRSGIDAGQGADEARLLPWSMWPAVPTTTGWIWRAMAA